MGRVLIERLTELQFFTAVPSLTCQIRVISLIRNDIVSISEEYSNTQAKNEVKLRNLSCFSYVELAFQHFFYLKTRK